MTRKLSSVLQFPTSPADAAKLRTVSKENELQRFYFYFQFIYNIHFPTTKQHTTKTKQRPTIIMTNNTTKQTQQAHQTNELNVCNFTFDQVVKYNECKYMYPCITYNSPVSNAM